MIGVTGPDEGGWPAWFFTWLALWRCGGRAVRITPKRSVDITTLNGLIIGGGADVTEPLAAVLSAAASGEGLRQRHRWRRISLKRFVMAGAGLIILVIRWLGGRPQHGVDVERDRSELGLLEQARARELPVLGICRGAQLMNLACGGTLVREVADLYEERVRLYTVLPRRSVRLTESSLLRCAVGRGQLRVNSLHRHAVATVAAGFIVAAQEPAGIVQAVERASPVLWWGVQWHPEYLPQSRAQMRLLRFWIAACRPGARIARAASVTSGV